MAIFRAEVESRVVADAAAFSATYSQPFHALAKRAGMQSSQLLSEKGRVSHCPINPRGVDLGFALA